MKLDKTTHNVQMVLNLLQDLELEIFKFKNDESMCQCKKDIFTMLYRRLQYITMLLSSTKYIYDDDLPIERINILITKLLDDEELHIPEHSSIPVAKLYLEILSHIFGRYKIFTKKLYTINDFSVYLKLLEKRIKLLSKIIKYIFYVVYPYCPLLEPKVDEKCTRLCTQDCVNPRLFGNINVIYVPGDYLNWESIYSIVYRPIWNVLKYYCNECFKLIVYSSSECVEDDKCCNKELITKRLKEEISPDIMIEFRNGIHLYFEKLAHELIEEFQICQLK